jgi:hypothetical protein
MGDDVVQLPSYADPFVDDRPVCTVLPVPGQLLIRLGQAAVGGFELLFAVADLPYDRGNDQALQSHAQH